MNDNLYDGRADNERTAGGNMVSCGCLLVGAFWLTVCGISLLVYIHWPQIQKIIENF